MDVQSLLVFILIGAITGWLLGMMGLFPGDGFIGQVIGATVGAVVLLLIIKVVRRAT